MTLDEALQRAGLTKADLSRETRLGLTTIWRAATGRPVDAKSARTLCDRFPKLSFEVLTLGDPSLRDADDEETVTVPPKHREVRS